MQQAMVIEFHARRQVTFFYTPVQRGHSAPSVEQDFVVGMRKGIGQCRIVLDDEFRARLILGRLSCGLGGEIRMRPAPRTYKDENQNHALRHFQELSPFLIDYRLYSQLLSQMCLPENKRTSEAKARMFSALAARLEAVPFPNPYSFASPLFFSKPCR